MPAVLAPWTVTAHPASGTRHKASPGVRTSAGAAIAPVKASTPSQTRVASLAGVTATVTATPVALSVDPAEVDPQGNTTSSVVTCTPPGTPWTPDATSDCTHEWMWSSRHHPTGRFPVTVRVQWEVTWRSTDGDGGVLEAIDQEATTPVLVHELQAVITR